MLDRIDLLTGTDFQRFCSVLLSSDDPQFAAVDGSGGDLGNDGFRLVGDTLYQAYGPAKREAAKVRTKIDVWVAQAVGLRGNAWPLRRLVFLTCFDLTHEQHLYLQGVAAGAGLAGEPWGASRLASILARHPEIRRLFPQFLLPDVAGDVQAIRAAVEAPQDRPKTLDDVFGEDFEPNLNVLQWNEKDPARDLQADEYFRVRIYSPAFTHMPFEPHEEDAFRDAIRATFAEDFAAELEPSGPEFVLVGHRHPRFAFHRRWGWWATMSKPGGAVGMAATLRDLWRDGVYSTADITADLVRFLTLAGRLAGPGEARVVFGMTRRAATRARPLRPDRTRAVARSSRRRTDHRQASRRPTARKSRPSALQPRRPTPTCGASCSRMRGRSAAYVSQCSRHHGRPRGLDPTAHGGTEPSSDLVGGNEEPRRQLPERGGLQLIWRARV